MVKPIVIFLDTEFTDFTNPDLISIGMITEVEGLEFYREITDHEYWRQTEFVKDVVVPLLNPITDGKPRSWAARDCADWINNLPSPEIMFVIDYTTDYQLLVTLLKEQKINKKVSAMMYDHYLGERQMDIQADDRLGIVYGVISDAAELQTKYWAEIDQRQHHALVDARAMRYGFTGALEKYKKELEDAARELNDDRAEDSSGK